MATVFGVRFKRANKVYNFGASGVEAVVGDTVIVEVEKGLGMGKVVYGPIETADSLLDREIKKVLRKADAVDSERAEFNKESESEALKVCKEKIEKHKIPMKLVGVEYLFDASKAIFYFTSENRVDFQGARERPGRAFLHENRDAPDRREGRGQDGGRHRPVRKGILLFELSLISSP